MRRERREVMRHGFDRVSVAIHPPDRHALGVVLLADFARYSRPLARLDDLIQRRFPIE